jgi:hypothetical protein
MSPKWQNQILNSMVSLSLLHFLLICFVFRFGTWKAGDKSDDESGRDDVVKKVIELRRIWESINTQQVARQEAEDQGVHCNSRVNIAPCKVVQVGNANANRDDIDQQNNSPTNLAQVSVQIGAAEDNCQEESIQKDDEDGEEEQLSKFQKLKNKLWLKLPVAHFTKVLINLINLFHNISYFTVTRRR